MNKKTRNTIAKTVTARLDASARRLEREYFSEPYNKAAREKKIEKEVSRACRLLSGKTPYALEALDKVLTPIYSILSAIECGGNLLGNEDALADAYFLNADGSCEKEEATHVCFSVERCGDANNWDILISIASLFGIPEDALENDSLDYNRASADVPINLFY